MRQTAEQLPYIGSVAVRSRHGPSPACRRTGRRSGFTLIEVIVAMGILMLVSVAFLQFSITSYQWGSNLAVRSMAQNLAELTAEQIAGDSVTRIEGMIINRSAASPDFPANGTTWPDDLDPSKVTIASSPSDTYAVTVPGEFLITGITSFFPTSSSESDLPLWPSGDISALNGASSGFTRTAGTGDLTTTFPSLSAQGVVPNYSTSLYEATPNIVVVPMQYSDPSSSDSSLVLFRGQYPRFLRKILIKRISAVNPSGDLSLARYLYTVQVSWTFNGKKQMVAVTGERSSVY